MGSDHIKRLTQRISGAVVAAIVDPDTARAEAAAQMAPGAQVRARFEDALAHDHLDAVIIATPAPLHRDVIMPALEAGLAILCEKPLAPTPEESLEIIRAEEALGRPHIQVGFMRRFDREYLQLRDLIASKRYGELLALHCVHRNPSAPTGFTDDRMIFDSVVHELDIIPWLTGGTVKSIEIRYPKRNAYAESQLNDPQFVLVETSTGVLANVEINVSAHFGYQVRTEAVFERGVAEIGRPHGMAVWADQTYSLSEHAGFETRFHSAYDEEVQRWVQATTRGEIDGPSSWDGYLAAAATSAGVDSQRSHTSVEVAYERQPEFFTRG